ncbi:MAG: hypothetical protein ACYS8I_17290 [Planctomycetota bacterium]|jgi:hypothetical protein
MEYKNRDVADELKDLKEEERVRAIIGKIGGVPRFRAKLVNIVFIVVITASVIISIFSGQELRLLMIELATIALSLKIIYLIHCQMRVNHFEFWILSSLEWRLTEIMRHVRHLDKD